MSLENYSVEQIQELASLAVGLSNNPRTRETFLRLSKAHAPDTSIPEIDLKDQTRAMVKPLMDKIQGLENQMRYKKVEDSVLNKRNELYEQGYKKDDIVAIENIMKEKQIPSHDTAADFYRMQKQTATPTPHTMTPISLPTNALDKIRSGGQANLNQWARGEGYSAINDVKTGKVHV
jgi:hypothetical protein